MCGSCRVISFMFSLQITRSRSGAEPKSDRFHHRSDRHVARLERSSFDFSRDVSTDLWILTSSAAKITICSVELWCCLLWRSTSELFCALIFRARPYSRYAKKPAYFQPPSRRLHTVHAQNLLGPTPPPQRVRTIWTDPQPNAAIYIVKHCTVSKTRIHNRNEIRLISIAWRDTMHMHSQSVGPFHPLSALDLSTCNSAIADSTSILQH